MTPYILWLCFGVVCFVVEALIVTGVGFLFAGLGALTVGSLLALYPDISSLQQWILFFSISSLWAVILWKPLLRFRSKQGAAGYQNMVGDVAYIAASGLKKGSIGEASWSGTIMRAKLADHAHVEELAGGAQAVITAVEGNVLVVKAK